MEFYAFADILTNEQTIRENLTLEEINTFCDEIEAVEDEGEQDMVVYFSHWGRFHLRRETVMGGVRFSVPDCPNALAWTITTGYPPHPEKIVIHGTINRTEHDPEFIEGVENLLAALKNGLEENNLQHHPADTPPLQLFDLRAK